MEIDIKNKQLLRNIKLKLLVDNKTKIEDIEELSLTNKNFLKQELDIDLTELYKLKSLKKLSIKFFTITDEIIECFNKLDALENLEISMCKFETIKVFSGNVKNLYLYNVENFKLNVIDFKNLLHLRIENSGLIDFAEFIKYEKLCRLEIINCPIISIPKINRLIALEELYLQQLDLQFDLEIRNLEMLRFISLNGSKVKDKKEYLERIKLQNKNVKVEFEDNNRPIE